MLALNDPAWERLRHCYGPAGDIPDLLRTLAESPRQLAPDTEPWSSLWSSLCHQDDVYEASYAAVPHIVRIGCETTGPIDFSFFGLPAAIEVARQNGRGPDVPEALAAPYRAAVTALADLVALHLADGWDRDHLLCACAALAVAKSDHAAADAIMNLDEYWIAKINACDFD
jgi:hypothetical protein